jgi:hypothetical protein
MIYELAISQESCHSFFCFKQWISGVVIVPSTIYFIRTIGQYDEQLREKKRKHQEQVNELIDTINAQVSELNELCRNVTENANQFAIGRFNDKVEYFQRFLKGVKLNYSELYGEEMLEELKKFVIHWLKNFSGSFLNRDKCPLLKGAEAEINRCKSAQEVADATLQRLQQSQIGFHFQMPQAPPSLHPGRQALTNGVAGIDEGSDLEGQNGPEGKCGVTWFRLTTFRGCRCERTRSREGTMGLPLNMYLGCLQIRLLSRTHGNILFSFFCDILLIIFEIASDRWPAFFLVIINALCLLSMLACFEQINEIAILERDIQRYERWNEEVGDKRKEAKRNWEKVQQLHDLWLYRTLPCLTIMGKIHGHLADEDLRFKENPENVHAGRAGEDSRHDFLRFANEGLLALEMKLGKLEDWAKDGPLSDQFKETVGKNMKDAENCTEIQKLVRMLPNITNGAAMDLIQSDDVTIYDSSSFVSSRGSPSPPSTPRLLNSGTSSRASSFMRKTRS